MLGSECEGQFTYRDPDNSIVECHVAIFQIFFVHKSQSWVECFKPVSATLDMLILQDYCKFEPSLIYIYSEF